MIASSALWCLYSACLLWVEGRKLEPTGVILLKLHVWPSWYLRYVAEERHSSPTVPRNSRGEFWNLFHFIPPHIVIVVHISFNLPSRSCASNILHMYRSIHYTNLEISLEQTFARFGLVCLDWTRRFENSSWFQYFFRTKTAKASYRDYYELDWSRHSLLLSTHNLAMTVNWGEFGIIGVIGQSQRIRTFSLISPCGPFLKRGESAAPFI